MEPLNTRSLTYVRHQVREGAPPNSKGKFLVENKPNNRHHKMCGQFTIPPGQSAGEYSRDYPRVISVEGDERRYAHLESPKGDSLFAAYDPQEMKLENLHSGQLRLSVYSPLAHLAGCDVPHSSQFGLGTLECSHRRIYPKFGGCGGGDHDTSLCHDGSREVNTAMFCEATGQSYLRAVSWLCLATRTAAIRVRHGRPVGGGTI